MCSSDLKMALLPKSLIWAKTAHGVVPSVVPGLAEASPGSEAEEGEVAAIEVAAESPGG